MKAQWGWMLGLLLATQACDDPAKNKTKAVTTEVTTASQAASATLTGAEYVIEPATSKIEWVGSKVTGKHEGSFGSFRGNVRADGTTLEAGRVNLDIDTPSIKSDSEKLTGHLKSADFFDVEKFPKASFVSTGVKKGGDKGASHTITGNLTLHGVTKSITFPANVALSGDQVTVDAEFAINRKDFAINYPGKQDDLIRDDVVIKLTVRAKKKVA